MSITRQVHIDAWFSDYVERARLRVSTEREGARVWRTVIVDDAARWRQMSEAEQETIWSQMESSL